MQKIKNSAKRRKEIKKKLGEDPVESMDQLTYRGLRRQGAVDDDVSKGIFGEGRGGGRG